MRIIRPENFRQSKLHHLVSTKSQKTISGVLSRYKRNSLVICYHKIQNTVFDIVGSNISVVNRGGLQIDKETNIYSAN